MRISDWSSDVCSSDLEALHTAAKGRILLTDGGWGTQIQARKLAEADFAGALGLTHDQKGNNDILALTRQDVVTAIGEAYLAAGSDLVATKPFRAHRISKETGRATWREEIGQNE